MKIEFRIERKTKYNNIKQLQVEIFIMSEDFAHLFYCEVKSTQKTRCRPSKGWRCIPDVIIWVHVETYLYVYG